MVSGELGHVERSDLKYLVHDLKEAGAACRRDTRRFMRFYQAYG
jgi:hypothetical protein